MNTSSRRIGINSNVYKRGRLNFVMKTLEMFYKNKIRCNNTVILPPFADTSALCRAHTAPSVFSKQTKKTFQSSLFCFFMACKLSKRLNSFDRDRRRCLGSLTRRSASAGIEQSPKEFCKDGRFNFSGEIFRGKILHVHLFFFLVIFSVV